LPYLAGPAIIGLASSAWQAMVGRFIVGTGVGVACVAVPSYLSEVATPSARGTVVACYEIAIALGSLVASVLVLLIEVMGADPDQAWRHQVGTMPFLASLPLGAVLLTVPESPRWLLGNAHGNPKILMKALKGMTRLGCEGAKERLEAAKASQAGEPNLAWPEGKPENDLVALWESHHVAAGSPLTTQEGQEGTSLASSGNGPQSARSVLKNTLVDMFDVFRGGAMVPPGARRGLGLAIIMAILNQACASGSVLIYAQHLIKDYGGIESRVEQDVFAIAVALAKFLGVGVGTAIISRMGRRALLGWGGLLSAAPLLLTTAGAALGDVNMLVLGMCAFLMAFVATWGTGFWLIVVEITAAGGSRYGAVTHGAATAIMFGAGWLTSLTFVTVMSAGHYGLLWYTFVCLLMAAFAWGPLPETKGLTLEECSELLSSESDKRENDCERQQ